MVLELRTLEAISKQLSRNSKIHSTLAIIVDMTAPHKKDLNKDYIVKAKIFDEAKTSDPCQVFIYEQSLENLKCLVEVGDIIFLQNFQFQLWKGQLQAKTLYNGKSSCAIFSGHPQADSLETKLQLGKLNLDTQNLRIVGDRINALKKLSEKHFKSHTIPLMSKNSDKSSDFDMILRVTNCTNVQSSYKLQLTDSVNKYQMFHREPIDKGIYKVRSIAALEWEENGGILVGNDYTNFLAVPDWMKSFKDKEWDKFKKPHIAKKQHSEVVKTQLQADILPKLITLRELSIKESHDDPVRVRCQVLDIIPEQFQRCLKKFDEENNTEKSYEQFEGRLIYNIQFMVTDNSMQGDAFEIFLYTWDGQGNEFLPEMNPENIFGKNVLPYREHFEHIKNRLLEETNQEKMIELILSPMWNRTETIYRIVQTQLIL